VIVARTFSKIAALAGMRLGYAIASKENIDKMRPFSMGSINALVKHGGAASIKDQAGQARMKKTILDTRKKTTAELQAYGYEVLPSEANFFMVHIGRQVQPVIDEVQEEEHHGRPAVPPMTEHLRVSVGTPDDMDKFLKAFKEIFPAKAKSTAAGV
jgi:Histidinol-phosphate/aromatic aminotransferase and cobyric acid decarboxylase